MSETSSKLFREDPAAYYTELGAEAERERIIKLLEPLAKHWDCKEGCYPEDCSAPSYQYAIDLIKGEKNDNS